MSTHNNAKLMAAAIIEFNDLHGKDNVTITPEWRAVMYSCERYSLHISECGRVGWIKDGYMYHDDPKRPASVQPCGKVGNWYGKKGMFKRQADWEFTGSL